MGEKLILVADIWDSITTCAQPIPVPDWQVKELDKRYQEFTEGALELHRWESVHEALREKYKE